MVRTRSLVLLGGVSVALPAFLGVAMVAGMLVVAASTFGGTNTQTVACGPGQQQPTGASVLASPMAPGTFVVSSGFGTRNGVPHRGTDFAAPSGTPIYASAPGVVVRAGDATGFGKWIVIDHRIDGELVSTVYGHMWPSGVGVREGQRVEAGQPIAEVGSNGQSTGPHLHFEVWSGGRFGGSAVDPMGVITEHLGTPAPKLEPRSVPVRQVAAASDAAPSREQLMNGPPFGDQRQLKLTRAQLDNAATIVAAGKGMGIPPRGWVIAIATAMQESTLLTYANSTVPESFNYPHDAVGSDHDSVGLFQQRPGWGTVAERMDAATSTRLFYEALLDVPGWQGMPLSVAAQTVQRSAFPDAYAKWELLAVNTVLAVHGVEPIGGEPLLTC